MKDYSIHSVINNFFDTYYKHLTVLDINIKKVDEQYKNKHKNATFQIEVLVAYSVEDILLRLGYEKDEILKNQNNDAWLKKVEREHLLEEQTLVNPTEYYLFIEDSEKYHNDPKWSSYYNSLKNESLHKKENNSIEL